MNCAVNTGSFVSDSSSGSQTGLSGKTAPGSDVLFNPGGTKLLSRIFSLADNEGVLLDAYNLTGDNQLVVKKVVIAAGKVPDGLACCASCDVLDPPEIVPLFSKIFACDSAEYFMDQYCGELELPGPGFFQIELVGNTAAETTAQLLTLYLQATRISFP